MTEREIAELRRRFRADKSNITHVRGCYVNENREVISEFDQSIAMMGQEESEKLLANLRRTLSGTVGKNLLDIGFDTRQVAEGEEHRFIRIFFAIGAVLLFAYRVWNSGFRYFTLFFL